MEIEKEINRLISLLKKYNLSVENLYWRQYLPKEVEELFDKILKETGVDDIIFTQELKKHHQIDLERISRSKYWDIDIIRKRDLVQDTYPNVEYDRYGLVKVDKISYINKNGFYFNKKYNLIFPKFISINFNLTQRIMKFKEGEIEVSFRIDTNELGLTKTVRDTYLAAHWWGPKTLDHIKNAFRRNNVAVKGNNKTKKYNLSDKVDFQFYYDVSEDKYMFKVEETIPFSHNLSHEPYAEINETKYHFYTRFAHAILNKDMDQCEHLDLSIKWYDNLLNYQTRSKTDISKIPHSSNYLKLIKFDSPEKRNIPYQELIGLYFIMNPYFHEMFDGENEETKEIERIREGILYRSLEKLGFF